MAFDFVESVSIGGPSVHGQPVHYPVQRVGGQRYIRLEKVASKLERLLGTYVYQRPQLPKTSVLETIVSLRNNEWNKMLLSASNSNRQQQQPLVVRLLRGSALDARATLLEDTVVSVSMPSYGPVLGISINVILKKPSADQCPSIELTSQNLMYLSNVVKWEIENDDSAATPRTKRGTKSNTVERGISFVTPDKVQVRVKVGGAKLRRRTLRVQDGDQDGAVEKARDIIQSVDHEGGDDDDKSADESNGEGGNV